MFLTRNDNDNALLESDIAASQGISREPGNPEDNVRDGPPKFSSLPRKSFYRSERRALLPETAQCISRRLRRAVVEQKTLGH